MKKLIINKLFLGDSYSCPKEIDFVLQAAKKFYDLSTINDEITLQNESSK
jgi:hypothetical protein